MPFFLVIVIVIVNYPTLLGSGSWLALTVVPRRRQWQPRARANGLLGPQLQPSGILRRSQPRYVFTP